MRIIYDWLEMNIHFSAYTRFINYQSQQSRKNVICLSFKYRIISIALYCVQIFVATVLHLSVYKSYQTFLRHSWYNYSTKYHIYTLIHSLLCNSYMQS